MYEEFFGLKASPFREKATGNDVFVGPQTAGTMAGFRKALARQDAVVTVSGRAGTGKTTLVTRSVDAFSVRKKIVRVSRMQMNAGDVLESLLIVLGVQDYPAGTIQRFTALRRKIKEFEDADVRVFVVIEDALRTGVETLAEIEALTAADAGESGGASIVVMGDEQLAEFMKHPQLAQLEQRIRRRHTIEPLSAPELRGYLRHCFRLAGGDFDQVFDGKCWELVHCLSGGVPRVSNNILDAAMTAAAEQGVQPVTAELVAKVAADEFQLDAGDFDFTADPEPMAAPVEPVVEPVVETAPEPVVEPVPAPVQELQEEPAVAAPVAEPDAAPEPVIAIVDEDAPDDDDIPELIQDTLPDLEVLAPELAAPEAETPEPAVPELDLENAAELIADDIPELEPDKHVDTVPSLSLTDLPAAEQPVSPKPEPVPELSIDPDPEPVPELSIDPEPEPVPELSIDPDPEPAPEPSVDPQPEPVPEPVAETPLEAEPAPAPAVEESSSDDVPAWDRDPTFAELKPDLEALEQAMAFAHGANTPIDDEPEGEASAGDDDEAPAADIPEITLDASIRTGIEKKLAEEDPGVELAEREPAQADAELEKIAAELAKAKTLEDVDDKMAETLFGSEISMIAAQVIGNPPIEEPANDSAPPAVGEPAPPPSPEPPAAVAPPAEMPPSPSVTEEVSMEGDSATAGSAMDLSASQRLKTVRALNADLHPSLREPANETPANGTSEEPDSIEDQINTSITQTLKTLKIPPEVANEDDEEEPGKSGFFSRFKRS